MPGPRRLTGFLPLLLLLLVGCSPETTGPGEQQAPTANPPVTVSFPDEPWFDADAAATVLVFTREDCPISNRYAPELALLHKVYDSKGVTFLRVYPDPDATPEAMDAHGERFAYPFPAVADPEHRLAGAFGVRVTPEAAVLDDTGRLLYRGRIDDRWISFGRARQAPTSRDLADVLEATLAGDPPAETVTTEAVGCYVEDLA